MDSDEHKNAAIKIVRDMKDKFGDEDASEIMEYIPHVFYNWDIYGADKS